MEEDRLLLDDGDLRAERRLRGMRHVLPVDQDLAGVQVVEPLDELDERRLARARAADQPDLLARRDLDREVLEERRRVPAIVEGHAIEATAPPVIAIGFDCGRSGTPIGSAWNSTSSSMSFTERCRLRMCMPTSRR